MIFRTLLIILTLTSSLFAQAKVGTTGAQFLEIMSSVRSLGMGEVAAPLIDRQSHFTNPATLSLTGDYSLSFTVRPIPSDLGYAGSGMNYQYLGLASHVATLGDRWDLHLGLHSIRLASGSMIERTYQQGTYEGTGQRFKATANAYALTASIASGSHVKYGFGGTLRYVEENFHDFSSDGVAYDLGAIVRVPFYPAGHSTETRHTLTSLTAGVSLKNLGPDLTFIDKDYPLPSAVVFGLSLELQFPNISLLAAVQEQMTTAFEEREVGIGIETGLYDMVWLRLGRSPNGDFDDLSTFGTSISVRGLLTQIAVLPTQSFGDGLFSRLDLIATYASSIEDREVLGSGADYYQLELVF